MTVGRLAVAALLAGRAVLLWPLDGRDPSNSALYPHDDRRLADRGSRRTSADAPG